MIVSSPPLKTAAFANLQILWMVLLSVIVTFLVFYPIISLVFTSFQVNEFGRAPIYGWGNWQKIFVQHRLGDAVLNTLSLSAMRQFISMILGVLIAWMIARTNLPGRHWIEVGFWVALFMPALPVTLSWVFLMGGRNAFLNQMLMRLPFIDGPVFHIYSWWGIIWVHLMTSALSVKVFLLVPVFRSINSAHEEAARACGASVLRTLLRVVLPIMMPAIFLVFLLGMIRSMQAFEVELILGAPARIDVYSTVVYRAMTQEPPLQGIASSLSITFLLMVIPFVILQQWYAAGHSYASVTGKFNNRLLDLGAWRWPLFSLVMILILLMTVVPFICLLAGTFMKLFGMFNLPHPWTTDHWVEAFSHGDILRSFWNTIELGLLASGVGILVYTTMAYIVVKTNFIGRNILDFVTWLPALIPGIVLSLGLLQMFAGSAIFRPFYGSIVVLILAVIIGTMTVGTQIIKTSLGQLSRELEEAAWAAGASRFYTIRKIILPIIAPSIAVIGLEVFAAASSAVGIIALLGTGGTQPMSILQLVLLNSGAFESGSVVGILIMTLTVSSALLARHIGNRAGLRRHAAIE